MDTSDSEDNGKRIRSKDIRGLKYLKALRPLLKRLRKVGAERDRGRQRKLFMDQYCTLILLWLFSPTVDSLAGLRQLTELKKIQKKFGISRASAGSLSESVRIFDPEAVKEIMYELAKLLPQPKVPERLSQLSQTLVAVDGTVVKILMQVAELAWINKSCCGYRLHTHFEVLRGLPRRIDVTGANPKGPNSETAVLERTVAPDHCYLMDRGYAKYQLWNRIHALGSNYVCRVSDKIQAEVLEDRLLTEQDRLAGVLSDQLVRVGADENNRPDHSVRMICVRCSPHTSRGRTRGRYFSSTGPSSDGVLRIATDMLDLPAELIAYLYKLRWTIELFFRMLKQLLGCRHLLSTKQEGVEIQAYCALIACMLILLYTGRTPTKRTFEILCYFIMGWATLEEVERHLERLRGQPP